MSNYVTISKLSVNKNEDTISVMFNIEDDKPFKIGEKMNEINEDAYMNGYNWEAFFYHYLSKNYSQLLDGMVQDPEAGSYFAHYDATPENEVKAEKFKKIIEHLIENEEELYKFITEEGDNIAWD